VTGYKTIILPVILYGCENWLLHKGKNRLRLFSDGRDMQHVGGKEKCLQNFRGKEATWKNTGIHGRITLK
jgi:hypothetical protein